MGHNGSQSQRVVTTYDSKAQRSATFLALKMDKGATHQRIWTASTNWKRQGSRLTPRARRRNTPP